MIRNRRLVFIGAALGISGGVGTAQQQSQPPRFQAGVELTRLEITVLHQDTRKPIRGLKAEDFVVTVDGKARRIAMVSEMEERSATAAVGPAFAEAAHDVTTNNQATPRVFVIHMNDALGANDPFTRKTGIDVGNRLIDMLGPTDMAAVVFARDNSHAQDLTSDRTLLRRAVERYRPMTTAGIDYWGVLRRVHAFTGSLTAYRRAVMYITPPISDTDDLANTRRLGDTLNELAYAMNADPDSASTVSRASHVPVYLFGIDGLEAPTADTLRAGRLRSLGDVRFNDIAQAMETVTGGRSVVNTNRPAAGVPAIFEELSTYYLLAYEGTPPPDGKYRWVQVDVKHPDAMVLRSRILVGSSKPGANRRATEDRPEDSGLLEAIAAPLPSGDLPLRLSNVAIAVPGKREQAVALTLGFPSVAVGTTEAFRATLMLFDGEGRRQVLSQTHDVKVPGRELREGEWNEIALRLDLRPGRYQLRIGVERPSTRTAGSVHATLVVPDFQREPLSLSGVALLRPAGPPIAGREALTALLPGAPTAVRLLNQKDRATALVRVHQSPGAATQAVVLDTVIVDAHGAEVHSATTEIPAGSFADVKGVEHRFDLPLANLPPGDYLLRIIASGGRHRSQRDVRFTIR